MYSDVYQGRPPTLIPHSATLESIHPLIFLCFVLMQYDYSKGEFLQSSLSTKEQPCFHVQILCK